MLNLFNILPDNFFQIFSGKNKEIYGYGFFNKFYPLEEKYSDVPPSYFPYDPYTRKISVKNYDLMKEEYKEKANRAIDNALKAREKGLITADEAIKIILERFAE